MDDVDMPSGLTQPISVWTLIETTQSTSKGMTAHMSLCKKRAGFTVRSMCVRYGPG